MRARTLGWTATALIAVPAIGLAALLVDPTGFPFWRGGAYSDLLISHWPIAAFIRESIATWRQVPLWNPLILSGMPLAADPLSGFWYVPNVLAWLIPSGLAFNVLFWAHLGFAALGVMKLLRSEGASPIAALLGGLAFAATPKLLGHVGLGHLTFVEAVCWTPWVLLGIQRAIEGALEVQGRLWRFGIAGALVGLTFLVDPRWVIPAGLLSVAYAGKCIAHSQFGRQRIHLAWALTACAFGFGVGAPALIPLAELLPRTTRWGMTADAAVETSLSPARLIGAVLFDGGGWPEAQTYLGATVVLLLVCGAAVSLRRGRFWTVTLLVGVLLALGVSTPLYGWVMRVVPGMSSLRVPARFYFIVALAAAMLAGHGLDHLREVASNACAARRVRLVAVGVGALALALPALVLGIRFRESGAADMAPAWAGIAGGILACAVAGCVLVMVKGTPAAHTASIAVLAFVALDLGWANWSTLEVQPAEAALSTSACNLTGAEAGYGSRRTFSPSYSLPQQAGQGCGLELADGVNPLQFAAYRDAMASATGFSTKSYSVTLPPFPDGDVRRDWGPSIDADALGMFNVDRIVSAYPLEAPGLELAVQEDVQWIYKNTRARPRAWIELPDAAGGEWQSVDALDWTPNRIRIQAEGPGRLVLSEIAYPGWRARVDEADVPIETYAGVLRSIVLPAGEHEILLTFVPASMYLGIGLAGLALFGLLALKVRR